MAFFETYQTQFEILAYISLAMLLGAVIGFERELEGKPAGLRTHMLVAGTAALFVSLGTTLSNIMFKTWEQVTSNPIQCALCKPSRPG